MASLPTYAPNYLDTRLCASFEGTRVLPRSILKPTIEQQHNHPHHPHPSDAASSSPTAPGFPAPAPRPSKSVNFWLETPFQTLSKVRSHCLVESHGSRDRILPEPEMEEIRDATVSKAVYNILFSMSGTFVLVVPGLFQRSGWWAVPMVMLVGCGMHHAAQCITQFVLDDGLLFTYRDVGYKALGAWGSYLVLALQVTNYSAAALISLSLGAENLSMLLPYFFPLAPPVPHTNLVCLTTFLVLPFCFLRNLDNIGSMSLLGYLASLLAVFCMAGTIALALSSGALERVRSHCSGSLEGVLSASTIVCFGFGGHMSMVFPGLLGVMRKPPDYKTALRIAFTSKTLAFTLFPAFCFFTFGEALHPNVLHDMPPGPLTLLALLLMTSQCVFMVAVVLNPLFYLNELLLGIEQAGAHRPKMPEVVSRCVVRSVLVVGLAAASLRMYHAGLTLVHLMQLVGGSTVLLSAWLLPVALYVKCYGGMVSWGELGQCLLMLALGSTIFGFNMKHTAVPFLTQITRSVDVPLAAPPGGRVTPVQRAERQPPQASDLEYSTLEDVILTN